MKTPSQSSRPRPFAPSLRTSQQLPCLDLEQQLITFDNANTYPPNFLIPTHRRSLFPKPPSLTRGRSPRLRTSKYPALNRLLHLVQFVVLHEERQRKDRCSRTQRSNKKIPHRLLIRPVDRNTSRRASRVKRVVARSKNTSIDGCIGHVCREILLKF
jgi:hypothetical protein